jgi:hypothetical protein
MRRVGREQRPRDVAVEALQQPEEARLRDRELEGAREDGERACDRIG